MDPKRVVEDGYDHIGVRYAAWSATLRAVERDQYTSLALQSLPAGAAVLDLGCGTGRPATRRLAERFAVTGVDLSRRNVKLAK